jgi:hypothetical protein
MKRDKTSRYPDAFRVTGVDGRTANRSTTHHERPFTRDPCGVDIRQGGGS